MAYQPPGPYPIMPMQPVYGTPQRPPIPKAALHSSYSILAGGALSLASLCVVFFEIPRLRSELRTDLPHHSAASIDDLVSITLAVVLTAGVIQLLLWAWMAWKIRTGRHWARVLSTVFFGINAVDLAFGSSRFYADLGDGNHTSSMSQPIVSVVLGWVTLAVGLNAVVLFWQKSTTPFFRPQQFFPPAGYPYPFPPQGYPAGPYPQVPVPGGPAPEAGAPEPPADPWSTPQG